MKSKSYTALVALAFVLARFINVSAATTAQTIGGQLPAGTSTVAAPAPSVPDVAVDDWSAISAHPYEMRSKVFAGLRQLESRVKNQITELTAKREVMQGKADTKDWDFAMKEMVSAQSYLLSMSSELDKATSELWDQQKEKVGQAWARTQAAYDSVKSSTTNR